MITGIVIIVMTARVCPMVVFSFEVMAFKPICAVRRSPEVNTRAGQR